MGYGRQITSRFAAGLQMTYVQETIWHGTLSAMTLNVGTLYRISERGLHLGASFSNFGTEARFDGRDLRITYDQDPSRYGDNGALPGEVFTDRFAVPVLFRVGVGMPVRLNDEAKLKLALDAFHPNDNSESVSAGAEISVADRVMLRLGYQNAFQEDSEEGLTLGAGVRGGIDTYGYRFDYAWADHGRLEGTHRLSVGLMF